MTKVTFENMPNLMQSMMAEMKEIKSIILEKQEDLPITINEASTLIGYAVPTLYSYVRLNKIPHHKVNTKIFFFKEELLTWIKEGKKEAQNA